MNILKFLSCLIIVLFACACNNNGSSGNSGEQAAKTDSARIGTKKTILFFGDSLTAGYGLDNPSDSFPGVIQHKIDSLKLPYFVVNAGVSGETSAGGLGRIDWVLKQKVDIFVLELGANDGLRGIPPASTAKNLQTIIDKVRAKYPHAKLILTGMLMPPSMGAAYADNFRAIFPQLAEKNKIALVPFLLYNVAGHPDLNQPDGIHPTIAGAKIVADNVWTVLKGQL
jgi:acyl-CoA thioesterase-1